jgi:predicted GNAT superfamily acetyltransferase
MINIKPLHTIAELRAVEELQVRAWGFEPISVVSAIALRHMIESGGILLGAFEGDRLIGFVLGSPGRLKGRVRSIQVKYWHASLMVAVLPEYQGRDVALRLKLAQRDYVLTQGLDLVTWTFDPLATRNPAFNFRKLGIITSRYERNVYGDMRDQINGGLETDRFVAEWWVVSPRVLTRINECNKKPTIRLDDMSAVPINLTTKTNGFLVNVGFSLVEEAPTLSLEIPWEWEEMRDNTPDLAKQWRYETREIFESYFSKGYTATEIVTTEDQRAFYLLTHKPKDEILKEQATYVTSSIQHLAPSLN